VPHLPNRALNHAGLGRFWLIYDPKSPN